MLKGFIAEALAAEMAVHLRNVREKQTQWQKELKDQYWGSRNLYTDRQE
jgi:hypothetical protein